MKVLLSLCSFCLPMLANAVVHTVSNVTGNPAQFSSLGDALAAAAADDTLLFTGSANSYGDANIDKPLTLIGAGYNLSGPGTTLGAINLYPTGGGTRLIGIAFSWAYFGIGGSVSDILIERCTGNVSDNSGISVNQVIIKNSYMGYIAMTTNWSNVLITNNLINATIYGTNSPTVLISNNVFIPAGVSFALQNISYAVISNNIFYGMAPSYDGSNVVNCAFNNNLSFGSPDDDLPPTGPNVGSGNLVSVDPLFVNAPLGSSTPLTSDYHLQPGSPGVNAGTDGTDIGIYGGSSPLVGVLDGLPRLPRVTVFNLLNSSISEGGSINVQVQGAKQD